MPDLFGGNQPRPNTILPGQWIYEVPSPDTQVHTHRFRLHPEAERNQVGPSSGRDVLSNPFERAWRRFNDNNIEEESLSTNSLERPCVIISQESIDGRTEKLLWYFTINGEDIEGIEGLEEILPCPRPLNISKLVNCSKHGHGAACLDLSSSKSSSDCQITFVTSNDIARHLQLLASALVEKMAWRKGSRIIMDSSISNTQPLLDATLRPITSQKLLLSLRPNPSTSTSSLSNPIPLILTPLGLPAIHISPSYPPSSQETHLSSTFESALGHSWKSRRTESRTEAQLSDQSYSDWSIYWVPLSTSSSTLSKGKSTPRQLMENWQSSQGVLTIWPTHLSQPFFRNTASRTKKPIIHPTQPKSSDLLDISTGLFDFFTTYKESEPPEEIEEDQEEEEDINMDAESTVITADLELPNNHNLSQSIGDRNENQEDNISNKSDLDDLFSEHSNPNSNPNSPPIVIPDQPIIQTDINTPIEPISIDLDDIIQPSLDVNANMENRQLSRNGTNVTNGINGLENGQKEEMVTEDDFAFFDSPTADTGGEESGEADGSLTNIDTDQQLLQMDGKAGPDHLINAQMRENEKSAETFQEEHITIDPEILPIADIEQEQQAPLSSTVTEDEAVQQPNAETTPAQAKDSLPFPAHPVHIFPESPTTAPIPPHWYTTDIIPPSFSPLPLLPLSESPFPYSLPTPAPTPSDLNWDLVERLQPPKSTNPTYADDWKMDEEISDIDDQESYTGPPTPESSYTSEDEDEPKVEVKKPTEGHEIEFGGHRCIGPEWINLIYEIEKLKDLAKDWNPSWSKENLILPPSPPQEVERKKWAKGLDLIRFAKEVIGNRALRELYDQTSLQTSDTQSALSMIGEGMAFSDLNNNPEIRSLLQPQISAGYHNYSINLSIPALQYWSELGLQPHGGYKDVEAVVLCEDSNEAIEKGRQAGNRMKSVWEELHLGKYIITEIGDAVQGVVSVPASTFTEAIANMMNRTQSNMVIYVLLPFPTTVSSSSVKSLFSMSLSPSSSTVIHLLPQHAITSTHLREIAYEVYNRLSEPIKETSARMIPDPFNPNSTLSSSRERIVTRQSFTLARTETPIPEFSMSWPLKSYDTLNTNRSIHACYTINEELGVVIIFIIDDLGELFEVNIWNEIEKLKWDNRIDKVFKWIRNKADEWFIVSKLSLVRVGRMYGDEMRSWRKMLKDSQISFTLLTTDPTPSHSIDNAGILRPRGFANIPITTLNDPSSQIVDLDISAQLTILPAVKLPIDLENTSLKGSNSNKVMETIYPISSFIITNPDHSTDGYHSRLYNILHHNTNSKNTEGMENELGEGIYKLNCLILSRWGIHDGFPGLLDEILNGMENLKKEG